MDAEDWNWAAYCDHCGIVSWDVEEGVVRGAAKDHEHDCLVVNKSDFSRLEDSVMSFFQQYGIKGVSFMTEEEMEQKGEER